MQLRSQLLLSLSEHWQGIAPILSDEFRANFGGCRSRVSEHPDHLFRSIAITRFGIPIGDFGIAIASFGASRSPKKG